MSSVSAGSCASTWATIAESNSNALDGGDAEELPLLFGQAFELAIDHAAQGLRDVTLDLGCPDRLAAPRSLEITHQIGHEERVAFGLLVNLARKTRVPTPGSCAETYCGDVAACSRKVDHQLAQQAVGEQIGLEAQKWMLAERQIRRPVADENAAAVQRRQFFREVARADRSSTDRPSARRRGRARTGGSAPAHWSSAVISRISRSAEPARVASAGSRRFSADVGAICAHPSRAPQRFISAATAGSRVISPVQRLEKRQVCFRACQALGTPTALRSTPASRSLRESRRPACSSRSPARRTTAMNWPTPRADLVNAARRFGAFMRSADGGPRRSHEHDSVGLRSGSC